MHVKDMAKGIVYLHIESSVIIYQDLKPRNVFLVNTSVDHLNFGPNKFIKAQNSHVVYEMTGETRSYHYMAPKGFRTSTI